MDYQNFEQLVTEKKYQEARAICYQAISSQENARFWKTQLGYVSFLDEKNDESYFNNSIEIFEELVAEQPDDVNALFWLGYFCTIIIGQDETAKNLLEQATSLNQAHPYANLVIAGLPNIAQNLRIVFLHRVLEQQPANFRAISQLADLLMENGSSDEGIALLTKLLTLEPYIERDYGIMNTYINDVLTNANRFQSVRDQAKLLLEQATK